MKLKLSRLAHATTVKKNENNKLNPLADTDDLSYYYRSKCCENQINKIEKKKLYIIVILVASDPERLDDRERIYFVGSRQQ
jgi:hypothetical protein